MYFNVFRHLFTLHIIIKSQCLISYLSVYVCMDEKCMLNIRRGWGSSWNIWNRTRGEGVKNHQNWAYILFEWPLTDILPFLHCRVFCSYKNCFSIKWLEIFVTSAIWLSLPQWFFLSKCQAIQLTLATLG